MGSPLIEPTRSTGDSRPWFRNTRFYPRPSRPASGIVFESSTSCIETTSDVANTLAKSAFRYISRHLETVSDASSPFLKASAADAIVAM
jgi:hypothetical protein